MFKKSFKCSRNNNCKGCEKKDACEWGVCPKCSEVGEYEDWVVGRDLWVTCPVHKTKWMLGKNLSSSWQGEDEAIWRQYWELLSDYEEFEMPIPEKYLRFLRKEKN